MFIFLRWINKTCSSHFVTEWKILEIRECEREYWFWGDHLLYTSFFFQNFRFKHNLFTSLVKIILFELCWFGMQVGVSMLCTSLVGKMRRWLSSFEEIYNISLQRLSFWGFRQQICRGKCVKGDKPWIWADHLIIVSWSKKNLIIVIVYIVEKKQNFEF